MQGFKLQTVFVAVGGAIAVVLITSWLFFRPRSDANQQAKPLANAQFVRQLADVPLAGGSFRFDYQSFNESTGQLYIAHLGAGVVTVFDTKTQTVMADLKDFPGVHGVLAVPTLQRVYASVTDLNKVAIIDAQTLKVIATAPTGRYPDGLAYSSETRTIFVSNQFGRSLTVLDAQTNHAIATIDLGGEVGNNQYDASANHIIAAVQTRNQLAIVDPKTNQVIDRIDVPGCDHPHGLLIDTAARLAFTACEDNAKLVTVSLKTKQVLSIDSVGESPDVLAFDQGLHRLYVASESGVVSIFKEQGETLVKLEDVLIDRSAHSVAVDPQTHRLYLPLERVGNQPVLRILTIQ